MALAADETTVKRVRLRYLLGEFNLFSFWFQSRIEQCFLSHASCDPPLPRIAGEETEALIRLSETVSEALPRFTLLPAAFRYVPASYRRYYVNLSEGFPQYLMKFSGKSRNTLSRKIRKFGASSGGACVWRRFHKAEEMEEFHALARRVSAMTYQERLLDTGLPDSPEFQRELRAAAADGLVRGYVLFHGQDAAAYAYCRANGPILTYELLGHDPGLESLSPGTVLLYHVLEDLFERDSFEYFDFGGGDAPYKAFFGTGSVLCADSYYFRKTVRNVAMALLHAGLMGLSDLVVRALDRAGVKNRVKKFFRGR